MSFKQIKLETGAQIARLTLNRPAERNAMTPDMGLEIREAVNIINKCQAARVAIISGAGQSFCSGADLRTLGAETGSGQAGEGLGGGERFYRLFLSIRDLRVPSIAAVNGHAIGAGFCLAIAADLRVIRRSAKIGATFVKLGIHPGMAATWNLPRLIGPANAAELLYTGRVIDGDEAMAMGLANQVAGEDFEHAVESLAEEISSSAPIALRELKSTLARTFDRGIDEALKHEAEVQARTFQSEDAAEGIAAILAKRKPEFRGC